MVRNLAELEPAEIEINVGRNSIRGVNDGKGEEICTKTATAGLARFHMDGGVDTRMARISAATNAGACRALADRMPPGGT